MHRALLVAHQDVLYLVLVEQGIIDVKHRATGIAEHVFDLFLLQATHDDFGA